MTRAKSPVVVLLLVAGGLVAWLAWGSKDVSEAGDVDALEAPRAERDREAPAETAGLRGSSETASSGARSEAAALETTVAQGPPAVVAASGEACCVTGEVVRASGAPVAGARVTLVLHDGAEPGELPFVAEELTDGAADLGAPEEGVRSTTTGPDGAFRLLVDASEVHALCAVPPADARDEAGLAPRVLPAVRAGERYRIVLDGGATLRVRPTDEDGAPVARGALELRAGARASWRTPRGAVAWSRRAALDGPSAELSALPEGPARLVVDCPGFVTETVDVDVPRAGTRDVTVRLARAAVVEGVVVRADDGEPVAGARVACPAGSTTTDERGRFRLAKVPPGPATWSLEASAPGFRPAYAYFEPEGTRRVRLELSPGTRVSGRVVDLAGLPIADARVALVGTLSPMAFVGETHRLATRTDADGRFELSSVHPSVAYRLAVSAAGHGRVVLACGPHPEPSVELPDVVLSPAGSIAGHVEAGLATADGPLRVALESLGDGRPDTTLAIRAPAPDGAFRFDALGPGAYRLTAAPMRGEPLATRLVRLQPGEALAGLLLSAGATIEGRVVDEQGRAVRTAYVTLVEAERVHADAHADGSGSFSLRVDGPGPYRLVVEDLALTRETVELDGVRPGEEPLVVRTWPFVSEHAIRGRVVEAASGAPATNVYVGFTDTETGRRLSRVGIVDETGAFVMENLRDRPYDVDLVDFDGRYEPVLLRAVRPSEEALAIEATAK